MSKRTIIAMLIVVFGLGIAGNASGQEKRQKSARKPSVNKPTAARKSSGNRPTTARLQGKNPNSFHIHVNPSQSARRKASAMQQSRVRGGQPIANRTETVDNNETITVRKPKRVQPGNSGGTISNQRTNRNSQDKLGNFEIQDLMSQALPLSFGTPRSRNLPQVQPGNSGGTISNQRTTSNSPARMGNFEIQGLLGNFGVQGISEANALWQFVTPRPQTIRPKSIQSPRGN